MNKNVNLLILGGGILNLKTIEDIKNHAFKVFVADGNQHAPCFKIADMALHVDITKPELVYEKIKNYNIHGVVSMAEAGVFTCAWLNEKLGLTGIQLTTATKATSKVGMRQSWMNMNYSVKFFVVTTLEEATIAAKDLSILPLIIKPDKTFGGSRGVSKINQLEELKEAFNYAKSSGQNELVVIEECAIGEEFSCEVLVNNGLATILCIGAKVKSPLPYRVDTSVNYPARIDIETSHKINDMVQKATASIGLLNGVAHIEFALTKEGPKLFELGARCGGGHTPIIAKHVSGVNEFLEYANIAINKSTKYAVYEKPKGAIYRFLIFEPGIISKIEISAEIFSNKSVYDFVLDLKEGDIINELKSTSQRSGACIVFSETLEEANEIANWVCNNILITYSDGRKKSALIF